MVNWWLNFKYKHCASLITAKRYVTTWTTASFSPQWQEWYWFLGHLQGQQIWNKAMYSRPSLILTSARVYSKVKYAIKHWTYGTPILSDVTRFLLTTVGKTGEKEYYKCHYSYFLTHTKTLFCRFITLLIHLTNIYGFCSANNAQDLNNVKDREEMSVTQI